MRFKEFVIESPVPAIRIGAPTEPTPPGQKRWGIEGKVIFAPATMTGEQVSATLAANPAILDAPVATQKISSPGIPAPTAPAPTTTAPAPAAPPGETPPPGHILVRSPTGEQIYVKQEFTDGKGKLNARGLELLGQQHKKLAIKATANVPAKLQPVATEAKQQADAYLGRSLSDIEWDALVRLANAEAAHHTDEQAWVMAAVLNSVRKHKNTVYDEMLVKNRMQSVTGNKKDPAASPNFSNAPPTSALQSVLQAASTMLHNIPKSVMHFTSANEVLYSAEKGTSSDWFKKLSTLYNATKAKLNPPGTFAVKVGGSIFATDFDPKQVLALIPKLGAKPKLLRRP